MAWRGKLWRSSYSRCPAKTRAEPVTSSMARNEALGEPPPPLPLLVGVGGFWAPELELEELLLDEELLDELELLEDEELPPESWTTALSLVTEPAEFETTTE